MDDKIFDGLMAIGHEIAGNIEGAGDTGVGAGSYEVFVERGDVEYRVTVTPYWNNETDEPIDTGGSTLEEELYDHLEDALVKGFQVKEGGVDLDDLAPVMDTARALLMIQRGKEPILPKGFQVAA